MKKLLLILSAVLSLTIITCFAEESPVEVINDLGDYKIVAEKYRVAVPHEYAGPVYMYKNYGVVDKNDNVIVERKYQGILPPSEGRAAFAIDSKIGFFDENWEICIENKYYCNQLPFSDISFSEGLAAVPKKDEERYMVWGYIDRDGNEVIDFIYDNAKNFKNGVAEVEIEEYTYSFNIKTKYGKIDKEGNVVEPFKFGYALERDYEYWWEENVKIQLAEVLVEINGRRYNNSELEYPFIAYRGYAYMPLTYYSSRMMGFNCDWTPEEGVMLTAGGVAAEDITGFNGMSEGVLEEADFYKGRLSINGKVFEYGDTAYPLIHYKNVVYLPVLWQAGTDMLGIEYNFIGAECIENSDRGCMVFKMK